MRNIKITICVSGRLRLWVNYHPRLNGHVSSRGRGGNCLRTWSLYVAEQFKVCLPARHRHRRISSAEVVKYIREKSIDCASSLRTTMQAFQAWVKHVCRTGQPESAAITEIDHSRYRIPFSTQRFLIHLELICVHQIMYIL